MCLGVNTEKGCAALSGYGHTPFIRSPVIQSLLALMTILAQSLLTLVSGHLVTLFLLSVRHNSKCVKYFGCLLLLHLLNKALGRLECGIVVSVDNECRIL